MSRGQWTPLLDLVYGISSFLIRRQDPIGGLDHLQSFQDWYPRGETPTDRLVKGAWLLKKNRKIGIDTAAELIAHEMHLTKYQKASLISMLDARIIAITVLALFLISLIIILIIILII